MKYYKLSMDMERENDIVCHYQNDYGIQQNVFNVGRFYENWDGKFEFYYNKMEGHVLTDYLANDKGWFVVSNRLQSILQKLNTEIQYLPVRIVEENSNENLEEYYIANITRVVDALCLEKSLYFETEIPSIGTIYTVSKYCIYDERTENSDIFKLANRQEIPIFVSERFKKIIEEEKITGICLHFTSMEYRYCICRCGSDDCRDFVRAKLQYRKMEEKVDFLYSSFVFCAGKSESGN